MKHINATLVLSALLLLSLANVQAGVRKTVKDTVGKTRNLAVTQVRGALSAVAQGADTLLYPAAIYYVGNSLYEVQLKNRMPEAPQICKEVQEMIPGGEMASDFLVRLVTGCLAVAGAHALVNTDTVGSFIDANMPHLGRLLHHVGAENGLKSTRSKDKKCGL